jgi:hypothetical protein
MAGRDRQTENDIGIVPFGADRVEAKAFGRKSNLSDRTLCNGAAQQQSFSSSLLTVQVTGQPDSQLESRMREIRPSGLGGGAVQSRPYLIPNSDDHAKSVVLAQQSIPQRGFRVSE